MKKYFIIIKNQVSKQLAYRVNIYAYRIGNFLMIGAQLAIWSFIYRGNSVISGFTESEMLSYVLFGNLFSFLTANFGIHSVIERDIKEGLLTNFLIKPISYLRYMVVYAFGRAIISMMTASLLLGIIIFIFRNKLIFNVGIPVFIILIFSLAISFIIRVFFSIILGQIAFWTTQVHGIFYSFFMIEKFMSGYLFPLHFLSAVFLSISKFLPFMYLYYIPLMLYLGKISLIQGIYALCAQAVWLFLLYAIIKLLWAKGLKRYEGVGI
jgi:ABC-2 type transport system permease protein